MVKKMMTNVFAVFVIFIVLAIIIPLPTPILDFLLIINIGLSLVILLMTMYIKKALEFSIFPTDDGFPTVAERIDYTRNTFKRLCRRGRKDVR